MGDSFLLPIMHRSKVWIVLNKFSAFFVFILVYATAVIVMCPAAIFMLFGGFVFTSAYGSAVWGVAISSLAVWVGGFVGGAVAFLLGRFVLRKYTEDLAKKYKYLMALDRALEGEGLKILVLLYLSPIFPWNVLNWILSASAIRYRVFLLAMVGMWPEVSMSLCCCIAEILILDLKELWMH